jgi:hypothetical protein
MNERPLHPADGAPYYKAMAEAAFEYERWVAHRKYNTGIRIYSRKELDAES